MADDYATYLLERYQGEVYGEVALGAMAEAATDPERARKLRYLEQLERETKERLRPALEEIGGSTEPSAEGVAEAVAWPCGICGQPVADEVRAECRFACGRVFHRGCHDARKALVDDAGACAICGFRPSG